MPSARPAFHLLPMNTFIEAAPQKTRRLFAIHGKINGPARSAKRAGDRLGCEFLRRSGELWQRQRPGSAVVDRSGNFERRPIRKIASAAEEPDFISVFPQQAGLVVEIFEIQK